MSIQKAGRQMPAQTAYTGYLGKPPDNSDIHVCLNVRSPNRTDCLSNNRQPELLENSEIIIRTASLTIFVFVR